MVSYYAIGTVSNKYLAYVYYRHILLVKVFLLEGVELGLTPRVLAAGHVLLQGGHALDLAGAHVAVEPLLDARLFRSLAKVFLWHVSGMFGRKWSKFTNMYSKNWIL